MAKTLTQLPTISTHSSRLCEERKQNTAPFSGVDGCSKNVQKFPVGQNPAAQ
jgi:hypothetical protein